ncbi:MAG: hypothetical protein WEB89_05700 [Balneolales bacterium]
MDKKSKFIASLAHDLKNSIGNSMMYSELLSAELKELARANGKISSDAESLASMSENIHLSSSKLINQINSWVYVQHLIRNQYVEERSTFNVVTLVENIINSNQLYLSKKRIQPEKVWAEPDLFIYADREILNLVLDNLLIQSIIFSDNGDNLRVSIHSDEDVITIGIADSCNKSRGPVISRFLGETEVTGDEIPDEGILKATGYGMIFCGLALKKIGAKAKVDKNDLGGITFSFQIKNKTDLSKTC